MQQSSSLPEQNSQIDTTSQLVQTVQQLRAELWLESNLNQLQSRLHNCLLSAFSKSSQAIVTEAEIFQTVVDELNRVLSTSVVAIALLQPQATVAKICYVSCCPSQPPNSQPSTLSLMLKKRKKLRLKLQEAIKLEDLQQMEQQEPPSAWPLVADSGVRVGWLIIATEKLKSHGDSFSTTTDQLKCQLLTRTAQHCTQALAQLRNIQSWQQQFQELEQFNQELERTNQLKNQFLANTSHEIRTPLSSIIGFTHLLLAQGYDPGKQRHQEYLNIIQSSGKHLLGLINDILDLSKIEANQLEVQWEIVDVPTLCRNVLALVKEKAANKGLQLRLELDANITTLVADPLRLKQMLLNLLFNALKFTSKGSVGLKVVVKDLFVHFTIWDTGIGISPDDQLHLFQPYSQVMNSVVARHEGTGLGLVVTQKLAEIHGGTLEMESEVERGSRFTLILPFKPIEEVLAVVKTETWEGENLAPSSIIPSPSGKILLVEDDVPNGELIKIYLDKLGYEVIWVKTAAEMWAVLQQLELAVILMDVHLPDANGLKLVQQLRSHQQYQQLPIIAQTAMAMKGDRETCLAAGVNDYISKPIDLPLLANLVSKYSKLM
jgi:K+-sensing histidine kinase KdpD/CheY-like chemotaxis protein